MSNHLIGALGGLFRAAMAGRTPAKPTGDAQEWNAPIAFPRRDPELILPAAPNTPIPPPKPVFAVASGAAAATLPSKSFGLRPHDEKLLLGVHPKLVAVVRCARARFPFIVVEGLRTRERQAALVAAGKSKTMNSRHLTGHAVDLAPWKDADRDGAVDTTEIDWNDLDAFREMARHMQRAADELDAKGFRWGGTFKGFFDGPHFEIDPAFYATTNGIAGR
jgi:peptidoglycan L-alanyl-D-glutamate endopeptidase CwlK